MLDLLSHAGSFEALNHEDQIIARDGMIRELIAVLLELLAAVVLDEWKAALVLEGTKQVRKVGTEDCSSAGGFAARVLSASALAATARRYKLLEEIVYLILQSGERGIYAAGQEMVRGCGRH